MGRFIGIDPGATQSAVILLDDQETIEERFIKPNREVLKWVYTAQADMLIIEVMDGYGQICGKEIFETNEWAGRFIQIWEGPDPDYYRNYERVTRRKIKIDICGVSSAKDTNVRHAILDKYPATGGGKTPQIGTKKQQGPLYGIGKDMWAALAVVTYYTNKIYNR